MVEEKFESIVSGVKSLNEQLEERGIPDILDNVLSNFNLIQKASKNEILTQIFEKRIFFNLEENLK